MAGSIPLSVTKGLRCKFFDLQKTKQELEEVTGIDVATMFPNEGGSPSLTSPLPIG